MDGYGTSFSMEWPGHATVGFVIGEPSCGWVDGW
jgi:hypothetical protein